MFSQLKLFSYKMPFASRLSSRIFIERTGPGGTRALPTETSVESGTSQNKRGTSVDLGNSGNHAMIRVAPSPGSASVGLIDRLHASR